MNLNLLRSLLFTAVLLVGATACSNRDDNNENDGATSADATEESGAANGSGDGTSDTALSGEEGSADESTEEKVTGEFTQAAMEEAQGTADEVLVAFNSKDATGLAAILGSSGTWIDFDGSTHTGETVAAAINPALARIESTVQIGEPEEAMGGYAFPMLDTLPDGQQFEYFIVVTTVDPDSGEAGPIHIIEVTELP